MAFHVHLGFFSLHPFPSNVQDWWDGACLNILKPHRVFTFKRAMWKINKMDEKNIEVRGGYTLFFQQIRF